MPHVRFGDEEEAMEEERQASGTAAYANNAAPGAGGPTVLHAGKVIQTTFGDFTDPDYVLDIATSDGSILAASLSTNTIKLYTPASGDYVGECSGHTGPIRDLQFPEPSVSPHCLMSCSGDGSVREWDARTQSQVGRLAANPGDELESFAVGGETGHLIAAGGNSRVYLWDRRTRKRAGCLEESHTEPVSQVRFHPQQPARLVSASVDGLICFYDTTKGLDEEECLESVLPVGTSVARIGFFGPHNEGLWCLTNIETLSLWNWAETELVTEVPDTRQVASQQWTAGPVDYLIRCQYEPSTNKLWLLAGTNEGTVGFFPVDPHKGPLNQGAAVTRPGSIGPLGAGLSGGHEAVVRAVDWTPGGNQRWVCWTGGEDGRLCAWGLEQAQRPPGSRGLAVRRGGSLDGQRHSPY